MAEKLLAGTPRWAPPIFTEESALKAVDEMFAAANSIPEGAPVGTVKQRPDGMFVAVRCGDVSPHPASWVYVRVMPGACEEPYGDDADSWPSYGEITPEPEGCGIGLDGECEGKCRKGDAPIGTIARRPDGFWIAHMTESGWEYTELVTGTWRGSDADSWPVIYDPDEYREGDKPRLERLMREPSVFDGDEDEVEELAKWLSIHIGTWPEDEWELRSKPNYYHDRARELLDFGYRKLSDPETGLHWFDHGEEPLVPRPDPTAQQEPAYTVAAASEEMAKHWDNSIVTTTKREPRVVDRLGVDEQGSRWQDRQLGEWKFDGQAWRYLELTWTSVPGGEWVEAEPSKRYGPYVEVLS